MSIKPVNLTQMPALRILPPRTNGLPLVGALPALLRQQYGFLLEARQRYGDVYTLDLGATRMVALNHPRHADYVLRENSQNYSKGGGLWNAIRELLGNGLVVSEGDFWLRQRRMIQPQFHRKQLAGLTQTMVDATAASLPSWEAGARSTEPFNVLTAFSEVTMRLIVQALFGQGLGQAEIDRVSTIMAFVLDYTLLTAATYTLPKWIPIPGKRRFYESVRELDTIVLRMITEERAAATPSDSMLGMLVHMADGDTGERMTDAQLRDEVMTFFLAGYETTSLSLTWVVHFLTQHLEVMDRLRAEVDNVLGDRDPTFADLPALNYTRMVIQESMRVHSPTWWLPRTAVADDEIDGFSIPAGTTVAPIIYAIHHNPNVWEDPETFDPERFSPERFSQQHKLAWMPFGAGQRQCIGRDFSIMEAQIILAMIVQRYTLAAVPGRVAVPKLSTTFKPKDGVQVYLAKR